MFNNIGLPTPRGSGTNGYIQRSLAACPVKRSGPKDDLKIVKAKVRTRMDPSLLEHEKRRAVEIQLLDLIDKLKSEDYSESDIKIMVEEERANATKRIEMERENVNIHQVEAAKLDTHRQAELKYMQLERAAAAFGIKDDNKYMSRKDESAYSRSRSVSSRSRSVSSRRSSGSKSASSYSGSDSYRRSGSTSIEGRPYGSRRSASRSSSSRPKTDKRRNSSNSTGPERNSHKSYTRDKYNDKRESPGVEERSYRRRRSHSYRSRRAPPHRRGPRKSLSGSSHSSARSCSRDRDRKFRHRDRERRRERHISYSKNTREIYSSSDSVDKSYRGGRRTRRRSSSYSNRSASMSASESSDSKRHSRRRRTRDSIARNGKSHSRR